MKNLFTLIILTGLLFNCENYETVKQQKNYANIIDNLKLTYQNAFAVALKAKPKSIYTDTYNYLKTDYFTGSFEFNPNELKNQVNDQARITSASELDLSFLTEDQKDLVIPFFDNILDQTDLSVINDMADSFNGKIVLSSLNEEQKYQLLSIGVSVKSGIEVIQDASIKSSSNGRIAKVDVKGALQAGVIGLTTGAIGGCYAGATGGTIVFPGLGTATGCVGGAVLSGAMGFISGVTYSIVQDLLFG